MTEEHDNEKPTIGSKYGPVLAGFFLSLVLSLAGSSIAIYVTVSQSKIRIKVVEDYSTELRKRVEVLERKEAQNQIQIDTLKSRDSETRDSIKTIVAELKRIIEKNHAELSAEIKEIRRELRDRRGK